MPRRILIADDNHDAADSLSMLFKLSGHDVFVAHTGAQALVAADQYRPDVALIDIGMPEMDGYEVARRIREEAWGAQIMLIAVTGWGEAEDKRLALAAGFDRHMTKPIDPEELERLLQNPQR